MNQQPPTVINRTASIRLIEGAIVEASDGMFGELADVIIDPKRRRATHLVVQPLHRHDQARLVPLEAVATGGDHVVLTWSTDKIRHSHPIEQTDYIQLGHWPHPDAGWDVGNMSVIARPYFGAGEIGLGLRYHEVPGRPSHMSITTYDRIPVGTAEIRRASDVVGSDDHVVGHVDGFVVDPDNVISHVILERGHLWGHREVTIPMSEVESVVSDRLRLRAARDKIDDFPTVSSHHRRN